MKVNEGNDNVVSVNQYIKNNTFKQLNKLSKILTPDQELQFEKEYDILFGKRNSN